MSHVSTKTSLTRSMTTLYLTTRFLPTKLVKIIQICNSLTNEIVPIKITAFEYNDGNGNKIYSIEAVDIIKKKSAGRLEDDSKENPRSPITDFDTKLIELFDNTPKKHRKFYKML